MIGTTSPGISHQDIYTSYAGVTHKRKVHNGRIEIISFVIKFRHCQFRSVGQGMKWYTPCQLVPFPTRTLPTRTPFFTNSYPTIYQLVPSLFYP